MELGILIACGIISTLALTLSIFSLVIQLAREKATHTVHMVPMDEGIDQANQEFTKQWASSDEAVKKEQKMYNEEVESEMPEFATDDFDKEVFSL